MSKVRRELFNLRGLWVRARDHPSSPPPARRLLAQTESRRRWEPGVSGATGRRSRTRTSEPRRARKTDATSISATARVESSESRGARRPALLETTSRGPTDVGGRRPLTLPSQEHRSSPGTTTGGLRVRGERWRHTGWGRRQEPKLDTGGWKSPNPAPRRTFGVS